MENIFENHNPFPLGINSYGVVKEHRFKLRQGSHTLIHSLSCDFNHKYLFSAVYHLVIKLCSRLKSVAQDIVLQNKLLGFYLKKEHTEETVLFFLTKMLTKHILTVTQNYVCKNFLILLSYWIRKTNRIETGTMTICKLKTLHLKLKQCFYDRRAGCSPLENSGKPIDELQKWLTNTGIYRGQKLTCTEIMHGFRTNI